MYSFMEPTTIEGEIPENQTKNNSLILLLIAGFQTNNLPTRTKFIKTDLKFVNSVCLFENYHLRRRGSMEYISLYRVIRRSLRNFRPLRYSSRDGHAEGEHVNRGRDTPTFCPTLQVLDMSTLGDAADVNPVIKFLPHTYNLQRVWQELDYRIDIYCVTKDGHIEHL